VYVYVKDRKERRRKSEKSKPNEQTFIDVCGCVRERERYCSSTVAYVPIHMIIEEKREKHRRTYPFMNIDQLVIAHRQNVLDG
jgi:hypothetical protein